MREFNDVDRKKKRGRIELPENPDNLSPEALSQLELSVKAALDDGYITCPKSWRIAKDLSVSKLAVGVEIDKLGVRVTDCQLGCFKVSKTPFDDAQTEPFDVETASRVERLKDEGGLTCANIFALAEKLGVKPRSVSEAANVKGYKLGNCQLGCF